MTDANEALEEQAAETDPELSAEEKARRLTPALAAQADRSERRESEETPATPPAEAAPGVAAHEEEMRRRGALPGADS